MPSAPERTALYRFYGADGDLLYVGISIDPDGRWKAHRDNKEKWVPFVARRTVEWLDSRPEALDAEARAIRSERPRYNGTHNYDEVVFDPSSWPKATGKAKGSTVADLMRNEIQTGRWATGMRIPPLSTLATAAGVGRSIVSSAAKTLKNEGLLSFRAGHGLFVEQSAVEPAPSSPPSEAKTFVKLPHDWCWSQLA